MDVRRGGGWNFGRPRYVLILGVLMHELKIFRSPTLGPLDICPELSTSCDLLTGFYRYGISGPWVLIQRNAPFSLNRLHSFEYLKLYPLTGPNRSIQVRLVYARIFVSGKGRRSMSLFPLLLLPSLGFSTVILFLSWASTTTSVFPVLVSLRPSEIFFTSIRKDL